MRLFCGQLPGRRRRRDLFERDEPLRDVRNIVKRAVALARLPLDLVTCAARLTALSLQLSSFNSAGDAAIDWDFRTTPSRQ